MTEKTNPLGRPARVTFAIAKVVVLRIRGEPHPERDKGMYLPLDDGKVATFARRLDEEKIRTYGFATGLGSTKGGGMWTDVFAEEDVGRVLEICRELGIEQVTFDEQSALHRRGD